MDFCGGVHPISPSSTSSSSSNSSSRSIEGGIRLPSDEELRREGLEKVVQRLRFVENEHKKILVDRSRSMRDVNKKLQVIYNSFSCYFIRYMQYAPVTDNLSFNLFTVSGPIVGNDQIENLLPNC